MSWDSFDKYERYDTHKERAKTRLNRPRSKQRPKYSEAITGRVIEVARGRYQVYIEQLDEIFIASKAREIQVPIIGDIVAVVGDFSAPQAEGALARIVRIEERKNLLKRSADDKDKVERTIVVNADQLLIITASANPEPRVRLIERYLIAAFDAGITPVLVVTKTDLASPDDFIAEFSPLHIQIITTDKADPAIDELLDVLNGKFSVLAGHSGVGKSTLVNALVPSANRATGGVNIVTGRGTHTSSSSSAFRVPNTVENTWIVDTPGVRSFGLGHIDPENIVRALWHFATGNEGETIAPGSEDEIIERIEAGELGEVIQRRLLSMLSILDGLDTD